MKSLSTFLLSIIAVFAPIQSAIFATIAMVFADLLLGVWAAVKRKESVTSAGLGRTVSKLVVYLGAIVLAFVAEKYLTGSMLPVCKLVTTLIGAAELKSCLENVDSITGVNTFQAIITKLSSKNDSGAL